VDRAQQVQTSNGTVIRTVRAPTGAQVAIVWNCGILQDRAPWIMGGR
jgi:hypothetical protein